MPSKKHDSRVLYINFIIITSLNNITVHLIIIMYSYDNCYIFILHKIVVFITLNWVTIIMKIVNRHWIKGVPWGVTNELYTHIYREIVYRPMPPERDTVTGLLCRPKLKKVNRAPDSPCERTHGYALNAWCNISHIFPCIYYTHASRDLRKLYDIN